MLGLPVLPDFTKIQPMFEEALATFKKLAADIELIKEQQAEILRRLPAEKEGE